MASIYHSVDPNADLNCGICLEPLSAKVVAHDKGGELHPVHEKCISAWAIAHQTCPGCQNEIDPRSLPSVKKELETRNQAQRQKCKNACKTIGKLVLTSTITVASALTAYTQKFQFPFASDPASLVALATGITVGALATATTVFVVFTTPGTLMGAVERQRELDSLANTALTFAASVAASTVAFVAYKVLF